MTKIIKWIVVGGLMFPALVLAQGISTTTRPGPQIKDAAHTRVEAWRGAMQQKFASTSEELRAKRQELQGAFAERREAIIMDMKTKRDEFLALLKQKVASTSEAIKEKKEALKEEAQQGGADIIERYYTRVGAMFETRIDRLARIADRLAERIVKIEEEHDVDLSSASAFLEDAQALLDTATQKAEEFSDKADDVVDPTATQEAIAEMKALRQEVWDAIKAAHQKLVEAIAAVKAGLGEEDSHED